VRVVCVGLATVDVVHGVDRIPGIDEKAQASSFTAATGGPAANAAVTAAALGASVTLITAVGAHPLGHLIREDLAAHRVTLLDAVPLATEAPPVSAVAVLTRTGQRTITSRNAAGMHAPAPAELDPIVAAADAVLVDGHHPALAVAAAHTARRARRPLVVDAGSWRPVMAELLPLADVVACSGTFRHPDAAAGTGAGIGPAPRTHVGAESGTAAEIDAATAAALRAAGVRHVAVTHGPEPVRWWSPGRAGTVAVPSVAAVDTAGAGDAFHGALTVAVAGDPQVTDLAAALRYAVQVAGIRVVHAGPRTWLADPRLPGYRHGTSNG
jgi:sugar/nucleoside kinase (ribokinase family)